MTSQTTTTVTERQTQLHVHCSKSATVSRVNFWSDTSLTN